MEENMAKINYEYCESEDLYNSGNVEQILLDKYKNGEKIKPTDYFYIMTPIRENIINWYPFKKNSSILEVGGGLGSITGALCASGNEVISCEYSKRRAENIYYRHKDKDNLEVIVGNVGKVDFKKKFDYIVLIGVFEYSKRFFPKEKNPFEYFLNILKSNLKDDGVIFIAIENRYGIKYWAGASEDHYGKPFVGLSGYDNYDIETLGKAQLDKIISEAGFKHTKYYYPYPDYKMPYIIHTDKRLPLKSEVNTLNIYNHYEDICNYDYRKVLNGIVENNQYSFFANSYLLEIGNNAKNFSDVSYVKTNMFREDNCQINTIIRDNNKITKVPKTKLATKHLNNMISIVDKLKKLGLNVANIKKEDSQYEIDFMEGKTLAEYIYDLTLDNKKEEIIAEIDKYWNYLKNISTNKIIKDYDENKELKKYHESQKELVLKYGLFDLQMSNIMINNDNYYVIDQEWISKKSVPTKLVMYFSIDYLYIWIDNFDKIISKTELLKKYNITKKEEILYRKISDLFFYDEMNSVDMDVLKIVNDNSIVNIDTAKDLKQTYENKINNYELENNELKEEILKQKKLNNDLLNSKSYKITKPLRKIVKVIKKNN